MLGLGEKRKEGKREEEKQEFAKNDRFWLWISQGIDLTRYIIMPPRRAVKGCPARRNVEEQELPNAPEVQPQGKVTNAEFREAIRMLSQVVTNQVG
uniref:Gag-pol polyprotein n=1 Tax=Solanum tuberosum TaxID=4113 RepID=M1DWG5_SOLTU